MPTFVIITTVVEDDGDGPRIDKVELVKAKQPKDAIEQFVKLFPDSGEPYADYQSKWILQNVDESKDGMIYTELYQVEE